jgi:hypothetical protein
MARRTMNNPTPSPSHRAESSRVNASKILDIFSSVIPMPVSQTSMRTFWPERRQPMRIRPLGSVYLIALTDQISQDAIEQHRIAHDGRASGTYTDVDPFLQRAFRIFMARLPKQRLERDGRELRPL